LSQPSNLPGIVEDLVSQINRTPPTVQSITYQTSVNAPSWCCQRGSGFAVASTDWDTDFNADGVTLIEFDVSTVSGFLQMLSDTNQYPQRYLIAWNADNAYDSDCLVHVSGSANVQIKFNGVITNYTTTTALTLSGVRGRNVLRIAHDGNADAASFEGRLFNPSQWVDLRNSGFRWRY